jgi:uncharacterized protein
MRLVSFSVGNYRSFFGEQTIAFGGGDKHVDVIFGPNGSGKTNLFMAIGFFRDFIRTSTKFEGRSMQYFSFMLSEGSQKSPTSFKAEMETTECVYRYHFSLLLNKVVDETLSRKGLSADDNYETIFSRKSLDKNRYEKYGFDATLLKRTRDDALVLTKAWENNNKYALDVFAWLDHLHLISGDQPMGETAQKVAEDGKFKAKLLDLLRRADLFIQDVTSIRTNVPDELLNSLPITDELKKTIDRTGYNVTTTHILRDSGGGVVGTMQMPLVLESNGTRRIFELAFPLIDTLEQGNILYVDELETHLHPRECQFIVDLFTGDANATGAQLVVNTHSTQLMDRVGRNNIHLFGKNGREETIIGSIPKDVRPDDPALERKYNKGMFGAVPNVGK